MSATAGKDTIIHDGECRCDQCEFKRWMEVERAERGEHAERGERVERAGKPKPILPPVFEQKLVQATETTVFISDAIFDFLQNAPAWTASNGFTFCAGPAHPNHFDTVQRWLFLRTSLWKNQAVVLEKLPSFSFSGKDELIKNIPLMREALKELTEVLHTSRL